MEAEFKLWCALSTMFDHKVLPGEANWVSFTNSFENNQVTIEELIEHITSGYSYNNSHWRTQVYDVDKERAAPTYRHKMNLMGAQMFCMDIDKSPYPMEHYAEMSIIKKTAAFLHTTSSNGKNGLYHIRVVFILDSPIGDWKTFESGVKAIYELSFKDTEYRQYVDKCTDALRLFYGCKNADVIILGNILSALRFQRAIASHSKKEHEEKLRKQKLNKQSFKGIHPYLRKALENAVFEVRSTHSGNRNNQLYECAFKLGTIVETCSGDSQHIKDMLYDASSLPDKEKRQTISSGINAGMKNPKYLEDRSNKNETKGDTRNYDYPDAKLLHEPTNGNSEGIVYIVNDQEIANFVWLMKDCDCYVYFMDKYIAGTNLSDVEGDNIVFIGKDVSEAPKIHNRGHFWGKNVKFVSLDATPHDLKDVANDMETFYSKMALAWPI